ncbi:MAG: hypothetical protein VSS75_022495 [Candidatus Parabeggiatoa sp.]|nr:hypothetical protein [Candidatus Parabeggiatoa sp.]
MKSIDYLSLNSDSRNGLFTTLVGLAGLRIAKLYPPYIHLTVFDRLSYFTTQSLQYQALINIILTNYPIITTTNPLLMITDF